jgi:hypothetical protein
METKFEIHTPKPGDTFSLGEGSWADICDVTTVEGTSEGDVVRFKVRRDGSEREFLIGSPMHMLVRWMAEET